ncbi:MAG: hypothetical protein WDW36_000070 [Sanguina aurantia]
MLMGTSPQAGGEGAPLLRHRQRRWLAGPPVSTEQLCGSQAGGGAACVGAVAGSSEPAVLGVKAEAGVGAVGVMLPATVGAAVSAAALPAGAAATLIRVTAGATATAAAAAAAVGAPHPAAAMPSAASPLAARPRAVAAAAAGTAATAAAEPEAAAPSAPAWHPPELLVATSSSITLAGGASPVRVYHAAAAAAAAAAAGATAFLCLSDLMLAVGQSKSNVSRPLKRLAAGLYQGAGLPLSGRVRCVRYTDECSRGRLLEVAPLGAAVVYLRAFADTGDGFRVEGRRQRTEAAISELLHMFEQEVCAGSEPWCGQAAPTAGREIGDTATPPSNKRTRTSAQGVTLEGVIVDLPHLTDPGPEDGRCGLHVLGAQPERQPQQRQHQQADQCDEEEPQNQQQGPLDGSQHPHPQHTMQDKEHREQQRQQQRQRQQQQRHNTQQQHNAAQQQQQQQQQRQPIVCQPLPDLSSNTDITARLETISCIMITVLDWLQLPGEAETVIIAALNSRDAAVLDHFVSMYGWLRRACVSNSKARAREILAGLFCFAL